MNFTLHDVWQERSQDPKAAAELAGLREQVAELASLASIMAKVEGGEPSSGAEEASSAAQGTQHLAATLRGLLQVGAHGAHMVWACAGLIMLA